MISIISFLFWLQDLLLFSFIIFPVSINVYLPYDTQVQTLLFYFISTPYKNVGIHLMPVCL